jgi:hypothetical protein
VLYGHAAASLVISSCWRRVRQLDRRGINGQVVGELVEVIEVLVALYLFHGAARGPLQTDDAFAYFSLQIVGLRRDRRQLTLPHVLLHHRPFADQGFDGGELVLKWIAVYDFGFRFEYCRSLRHPYCTVLQVYGSWRYDAAANATAIHGIQRPPLHGHDINLLPARVLSQVNATPLRSLLRIDVDLLNLDQSAHLLLVDVGKRGVVGGRRLILLQAIRRLAAIHDQHFIS